MYKIKIEKALNEERERERSKFDLISKDKFSTKLNYDMSELIKEELLKHKEIYSYSEIKNSLVKLIKIMQQRINYNIYNLGEQGFEYKNQYFDLKRDIKKIYDIIIIVYKYFPNDYFTLKKYKISKVRNYFIYEVEIKEEYKKQSKYPKYLLINYQQDLESKTKYIFDMYCIANEEMLNEYIKDFIPMYNPKTNKKQSVSLNNSENSNPFKSKSSRSS